MSSFLNWNAKDQDGLLNLLVGRTYGSDPVEQLNTIQEMKYYEALNIIKNLNLDSRDRVIDLGSGCGFIAQHIAKLVDRVFCVDISSSFLDYAKKINTIHPNVDYHLIEFADMSHVPKSTAIYSVAVFIHFNLYDCYLYLKECYACLESDGRIFFDFLNDKMLDVNQDRWQWHSNRYRLDQTTIFTNVHYNSQHAINLLLTQIGFMVDHVYHENDHTFILAKKP